MRISYLAAVAALALLGGCKYSGGDIIDGPQPQPSFQSSQQVPQGSRCPKFAPPSRLHATGPSTALPELTYLAIDKMVFCSEDRVSEAVPITVSSITDAQRLDRSSPFGNMIADYARARLVDDHMTVSEPRLRATLLMRQDQGEMFLSRDPGVLTVPHPPYSAVLTGTYAVGGGNVFVSLKLIRMDNTKLLAAADFVITRNADLDALLY